MKEKIIKKSEELFLTLGFKNVTMDDIASSMGPSSSSFSDTAIHAEWRPG